jgi:uncharacterized membrane protein YcaP (DUF421 family)
MGKRQIGELELSELVTTLLLSEIATLPITERDIPILFSVIPIITLLSLEVIMSVLLIKLPSLKNLLSPRPNVIIERGKLNQKELKKLRISTDELMCELRRSGYTDISDVYYAIAEGNGKLSIIPRAESAVPTVSQLGLNVTENGITHIVISDGKINRHGLNSSGLSIEEINILLDKNGYDLSDIFLLLSDDSQNINLIPKENIK